MVSLSFTLLPEALLQFHDVLTCLAKFNENVTVEAEQNFVSGPSGLHTIYCLLIFVVVPNNTNLYKLLFASWLDTNTDVYLSTQLRLTTLNSTKSAYASFKFDPSSSSFFSGYSLNITRAAAGVAAGNSREKLSFQIYLKVNLQSSKFRHLYTISTISRLIPLKRTICLNSFHTHTCLGPSVCF